MLLTQTRPLMSGLYPGPLMSTRVGSVARGNLVSADWFAQHGSRAQRRAALRQLKLRPTAGGK